LLHYDAVGISQYAPKPQYNQEASSGLQAREADAHAHWLKPYLPMKTWGKRIQETKLK